jgi:Secretion system C-terminal sorting domain
MQHFTPSKGRLIAVALWAMPLLAAAQASPQVYKNNGGNTNSTFALGNSDYARKTQLLYDPQSIQNAVAGQMQRVYFAYGSSDQAIGVILDSLTIRVGQTADVNIPSTTFYTGLKRVAYKPTITIPAGTSGDWFGIDLDSTFTYDPTQSLIVEITFADSRKPTTGLPSNFGTAGDNVLGSNRKKLCDPNPYATVSTVSSTTWQHFGFDVTPLGLADDAASAALQAFPSPAHERLTVRWPEAAATPANVTLADVLGRTVRTATVSASALQAGHSLSVSGLPGGTYVLTVTQNNRRLVRRVTVE